MAVGQQARALPNKAGQQQVLYTKPLELGNLRRTTTVKLYSQHNVSFSLGTNCLPEGHCTHKLTVAATERTQDLHKIRPAKNLSMDGRGAMLRPMPYTHAHACSTEGPCSDRQPRLGLCTAPTLVDCCQLDRRQRPQQGLVHTLPCPQKYQESSLLTAIYRVPTRGQQIQLLH